MIYRSAFFVMTWCCLMSCQEVSVKQKIRYRRQAEKSDSPARMPDTIALRVLTYSRAISIYELMSQHWELEDVDKKHWNEFFWDTLKDRRIYSSLYLFPDSTFTENPRNHIATGKWILNKPGRELILFYPNKDEKDYLINEFSLIKLITTWDRDGELLRFEYSADNMVHKKPNEDPFHPLNNRWRIKPASAESAEQIRQRVKYCVHFFALFFKDNRARNEKDISFTGLPNCFTWYNGGIALQSTFELDKKWIGCFYSEEQALQGYEMIKAVLDKHALKWPPRAHGWIEELQSVLGQIRDQL
jgi:hypothetical protein